jgi:NDP-sugar pyrophosphorylase family protein
VKGSAPRAFLLAAGLGTRFRPVTETLPKPLAPYLNVPLARAHLRRLLGGGISQAAVNLHHLGDQVMKDLVDHAAELPKLRFFPETKILGTAGGLRNAGDFLSSGDFLVVNSDAAIEPDYASLLRRHREAGRAATLLVVENREPDRYTPLQSEGDRITGFGGDPARAGGAGPLLYTGVCVLAPRLLARIPPGETSLVADLWQPLLDEGRDEIGWVAHEGSFADLGSPRDFLRATLEALARGGPFPAGSGKFDAGSRVLALRDFPDGDAINSVLGECGIGRGARIEASAVWSGCEVGANAQLTRCLAAAGRIPDGTVASNALLWGRQGEDAVSIPLR